MLFLLPINHIENKSKKQSFRRLFNVHQKQCQLIQSEIEGLITDLNILDHRKIVRYILLLGDYYLSEERKRKGIELSTKTESKT